MFFIEVFFSKGFNQAPLRILTGDKVARVLEEVHSRACGEHQWGSRLFKQLTNLGYYWPIDEALGSFSIYRLKGTKHVCSTVIESTTLYNWIVQFV